MIPARSAGAKPVRTASASWGEVSQATSVMPMPPRNMEEMAEVFGVGARKLERYGEAFLAVVLEHA